MNILEVADVVLDTKSGTNIDAVIDGMDIKIAKGCQPETHLPWIYVEIDRVSTQGKDLFPSISRSLSSKFTLIFDRNSDDTIRLSMPPLDNPKATHMVGIRIPHNAIREDLGLKDLQAKYDFEKTLDGVIGRYFENTTRRTIVKIREFLILEVMRKFLNPTLVLYGQETCDPEKSELDRHICSIEVPDTVGFYHFKVCNNLKGLHEIHIDDLGKCDGNIHLDFGYGSKFGNISLKCGTIAISSADYHIKHVDNKVMLNVNVKEPSARALFSNCTIFVEVG